MSNLNPLQTNFRTFVDSLDPECNRIIVAFKYRDEINSVELSFAEIIQQCDLSLFDDNTSEIVASFILNRIKELCNVVQ